MPAAVILLLLGGLLVIAVWLLARRRAAGREDRSSASAAVERVPPQPPAAPAATAPTGDSRVLSGPEVFRKLHELAFGVAPLGAPAPEALEEIAPTTSVVLDTVATEPRYALRRPLLLPQLLRAVNDDEVSRRELAKIIARDPALAGSLVKLANSPFYRVNERPVESVDRAVALLGTNGIRSLVAAAVMQPVFKVSDTEFWRFPEATWEHTYRSAAAAEAHAAIVEDSDPFAAHLLALTMGLGAIVVFRVVLDVYRARPGLTAEPAVIASILDTHTAAVAHRIAQGWDLSGRMLEALEDQSPRAEMRQPTSLGKSLYFGRLIGALAVLTSIGVVSDGEAKASMVAGGTPAAEFDRMWTRLTGRGEPVGRASGEPQRRQRT
jgi:HD-like signal output (HDOD) protein